VVAVALTLLVDPRRGLSGRDSRGTERGRPSTNTRLRSEEYAAIKADYDRVSTAHFPKSYVPPPEMSFAGSDALFPPAELRAMIAAAFEAQCRVLCFGPSPTWDDVQARLEEIRELLTPIRLRPFHPLSGSRSGDRLARQCLLRILRALEEDGRTSSPSCPLGSSISHGCRSEYAKARHLDQGATPGWSVRCRGRISLDIPARFPPRRMTRSAGPRPACLHASV
jgi:hypothetical protein